MTLLRIKNFFQDGDNSALAWMLTGMVLVAVTSLYMLEQKISQGPQVWHNILFCGLLLGVNGLVLGFFLGSCWRRHKQQEEAAPAPFCYDEVFNKSEVLIHVVDLKGNVLYVNQAWKDVTGYDEDELMYMNIFSIIDPNYQHLCQSHIKNLLKEQDNSSVFQVKLTTKNDQSVVLEGNCSLGYRDGEPHCIRGIFRDITHRKAEEERLLRLAYYDGLTGLPNRHLLPDRLTQGLAQARRYSQHCGIIYIDLDGFKAVNDTYGHMQGDRLLQLAAQRMVATLRENDTVSRIGGDEFAVILTGIRAARDIPRIVVKLQNRLREAFYLEHNQPVYIKASCGIAAYPDDGDKIDTLLKKADRAMYAAKQAGGDHYLYATP